MKSQWMRFLVGTPWLWRTNVSLPFQALSLEAEYAALGEERNEAASGARRGPLNVICCTTIGDINSDLHADISQLGIKLERVYTTFAPDTRLFGAPEGRP